MKRIITILFTLALIIQFNIPSQARTKRFRVQLKGRTNTVKAQVVNRRATIKYRQPGSNKWRRLITVRTSRYKGRRGYTHRFRTGFSLRGKVGSYVEVQAKMKLTDGREAYKEWKIKVSPTLKTLYSTIILSKYRGEKKVTEKPKEKTTTVPIRLSVNGKTKFLKSPVIKNMVTVQLTYTEETKPFYTKEYRMRRRSRDRYTFTLRDRIKADKTRQIEIKAVAKLKDGREIFAQSKAKVRMPQKLVNTYLTLNKFRGTKSEAAVNKEAAGKNYPVKGNISISGRLIKRVKQRKDSLPEPAVASVIIMAENNTVLHTISVTLTADKYGNYKGRFPKEINLPLDTQLVKVKIEVPTAKGRRIGGRTQVVGFKQISGKQTLWIRAYLKRFR